MSKHGITEAMRRVYDRFLEGLMQVEVAKALEISPEAVRKQKVKLVKAGYLQRIPETGLYERGPNAKFIDGAIPITKTVIEGEKLSSGRLIDISSNDRPAVRSRGGKIGSLQPTVRLEEYDFLNLEAHMHGYIIFSVEKVGNLTAATIREEGREPIIIPLFTGKDNLDYHNNHRWDCYLKLPDHEWEVHLQLWVTSNLSQLSVYPPGLRSQPKNLMLEEITHSTSLRQRYTKSSTFWRSLQAGDSSAREAKGWARWPEKSSMH